MVFNVFRKYKDTEFSVIFGYIQLNDASKLSELEQTIKEQIVQSTFGDLQIIWGIHSSSNLKISHI